MTIKAAARELSLVVVGDLNPAILHPTWFAAQGLIKDAEAQDSAIEVVHKEVALWELDWLKVHATTSRLQFFSEKEAFFLPLRDLMIGTLTLLSHTPISALGVNWGSYYQFPDNKSFQKFGHDIVPKERWMKALKNPVTARVTVNSDRDDNFEGQIHTSVSGHNKFPLCVYIAINDHFKLNSSSPMTTTEQVTVRITAAWDKSEQRPQQVADELFKGF